MPPELILQRNEAPPLIQIDGRGLRIQGIQAKIAVACPIVEKARVQDVPGRKVVLQPKRVVSRPFLPSVGIRQLLDYAVGVLDTDGIGKPKAPADKRP